MAVVAVIGGQWGDEGKGKIIDLLASRAKVVVRFSGGDNAGHTVINPQGEFKLHLVPAGIFYPGTTCIIANGVVVNPAVLLKEIDELQSRGIDVSNLCVSDCAHLIMPYHTLMDRLEEERRGKGALGTTLRGVGPAFTDKVARIGIRAGDLLSKDLLLAGLKATLEFKNIILTKVYGHPPLVLEEIFEQYCQYGERLTPFIKDTNSILHKALSKKELVLLEGAQGALLDLDFGTYPYVTSSSPLSGGACTGAGIGPMEFSRTIGVFKVYSTRVGAGPMITELKDEVGELIREKAHEYGTTTGRPRRCGWFDAVAGRLSVQVNGLSDIALTHLDIYDGFPSIKICIAYKLGDMVLDSFPSSVATLEKCQPVYEELPGWEESTEQVLKYDQLPLKARNYMARLEELLSCPVSLVTVGPSREEAIEVRPILP